MKAKDQINYQRNVLLLIFIFFVFRLAIAFFLELSNDESYYWTYSKELKLNYFDHPPLIAFTIRLFTLNLLLDEYAGFIRLGSVVCGALSTWFIYKATSQFSSERAGWFAACFYSTSFYAGLMPGFHAMPDAPQMVFWTFCLWMLSKIFKDDQRSWIWILFGVGAGFCIMSKIHGIFLWTGLGLYALFEKRSWLSMPIFYISLFLSIIIACPILIWNIQNDFVTFFFHSDRITINQFSINWRAFIEELTGQMFFNNPFHVAIIIMSQIALRKSYITRNSTLILFNFIGLPLAILLLIIALFRDTLPHWNGPAYITLIPLAGIFMASVKEHNISKRLFTYGMVSFVLFLIAWPLVTNFYPGTYGVKTGMELGKGDVTLDKYGWKYAGKQFSKLYENDISKGKVKPGTPLICNKWWGAHIEYYFSKPIHVEMIGLGGINNLHEYYWTNKKKAGKVDMTTAYCVIPSDEYYNVRSSYSPYYDEIDSITVIEVFRNKLPAHRFNIYRLSGWKGKIPYIQ